MDKALEILRTTDFADLEPVSYQVDEGVFYNVMEPELHAWEDTSWECHRKYIDIQYALTEGEQIAVCPIDRIDDWIKYVETDDYAIAKADAVFTALPMGPEMFAAFFPQDAHRPTWALGERKTVKKVVIKVLV